jgi:hypothetical protein
MRFLKSVWFLPVLLVATICIGATVPLTKTLPRDANKFPIQSAQSLVFQDANGTPVVSPKTGVDTTPFAFTVPTGAVSMIFRGTEALRYGDNSFLDGTAVLKGYKKAGANGDVTYPCANVTTIYIRAESVTAVVDFFFEKLD